MKIRQLLEQLRDLRIEELAKELELIEDRIKCYMRNQKPPDVLTHETKIMLRNRNIVDIDHYHKMVETNGIDPSNAYVYIIASLTNRKSYVLCPHLAVYEFFMNATLSKLGFDIIEHDVAPATGLTYLAPVGYYLDENWRPTHLVIDLVNLVNVINNLNLHNIVREFSYKAENKKLTEKEYKEIDREFWKRFGNSHMAVVFYYDVGNKNEKDEAERAKAEYDRVFGSYKVCYELSSWKRVHCMEVIKK